jgi:hypothetical protein
MEEQGTTDYDGEETYSLMEECWGHFRRPSKLTIITSVPDTTALMRRQDDTQSGRDVHIAIPPLEGVPMATAPGLLTVARILETAADFLEDAADRRHINKDLLAEHVILLPQSAKVPSPEGADEIDRGRSIEDEDERMGRDRADGSDEDVIEPMVTGA